MRHVRPFRTCDSHFATHIAFSLSMPDLNLNRRTFTLHLGAVMLSLGLAAISPGRAAWGQESKAPYKADRPATSITPAEFRLRQVAQRGVAEPVRLSPEQRRAREKSALEFAREHHPELERLLRQLRKMDPHQFSKAIRDLARVSDRLTILAERNPAQYEAQLALWKATSTATLLAARLQLNPDDTKLRKQLREALETKLTLQKKTLEAELDRAQQRVSRLEENLNRLDQDGDQIIDRQLRQLTSPANRDRQKKRDND